MFWKKNEAKRINPPEPSEEQLEEERRFAQRHETPSPRTTTGETTRIVNMTLLALDKAKEEKRKARESVKSLSQYAVGLAANGLDPSHKA